MRAPEGKKPASEGEGRLSADFNVVNARTVGARGTRFRRPSRGAAAGRKGCAGAVFSRGPRRSGQMPLRWFRDARGDIELRIAPNNAQAPRFDLGEAVCTRGFVRC